jgi:4,5-DOPA dioxygenase extradiol
MNAVRQPALFVPHGAPTFALNPGAAGAALERLAGRLPRPRAIIAVSAHWGTALPTVGLATRLETLHDFSGFPSELYALRYPATGCPEAAREVGEAIRNSGLPVQFDADRGLDHGAWVPLRLMFPDADVPVIPLSIQPREGAAQAFRLGRALDPLRERGFLVVASGNVTHNLGDYFVASRAGGQAPAYVREFADWMWDRLAAGDVEALLDYRRRAPHAVRAHPTEEHLLPLYVALGAGGDDFVAERTHAGIDDYVLAMDAYAFTTRTGTSA